MITGDQALTACHVAGQVHIISKPALILSPAGNSAGHEWISPDETETIRYRYNYAYHYCSVAYIFLMSKSRNIYIMKKETQESPQVYRVYNRDPQGNRKEKRKTKGAQQPSYTPHPSQKINQWTRPIIFMLMFFAFVIFLNLLRKGSISASADLLIIQCKNILLSFPPALLFLN